MTRARGQPSRTQRDRDFPFQVTVPAAIVHGKVLDRAIDFHLGLGLRVKTYSIFEGDAWFDTYCFADRQQAKSFKLVFGGKFSDLNR